MGEDVHKFVVSSDDYDDAIDFEYLVCEKCGVKIDVNKSTAPDENLPIYRDGLLLSCSEYVAWKIHRS